MRLLIALLFVLCVTLGLPEIAVAHPGHGGPKEHTHILWQGLVHPLSGWDHWLAMVTVGLLSAQQRGRAVWAMPQAFVLSMAAGMGVGAAFNSSPAVEFVIAASIVLLGAGVTRGRLGPVGVSLLLIGAFGFAHGVAHGGEMAASGFSSELAAGMMSSTVVLHLLGMAVGRLAMRSATGHFGLRLSGAFVACAGLVLAFQL